ncbi:MAG: long-chain fatty acid--CoA ligase [Microthrixaceae bacterium]|nr:long-chain fatty acid--CoA ligase [Microthrixaceae bacterium]
MTSTPMTSPDMSWVAVLEHHARRRPDAPIVEFEGRAISYAEMADRSAAVAASLRGLGVDDGQVVALLAYNSADFLTTIFAANTLGAVAMPINWRLAPDEVRYILDHSQAVALVCDADTLALGAAAADLCEHDQLVRVAIGANPAATAAAVAAGWHRFDDLAATDERCERLPAAGSDLHRLMYTSGTTGRPKGVMITHENLAWKNAAHVAELGFTSADVGLACGPLYHVGALDLVTTSMMSVGARTIVHRSFDPAAVVDEIERSKVTVIWAAPAMVRAVLDVEGIETRDLSSVKVIIAGGEKMPIPTIERIGRIFPSAWFADAYGLTETVSGDTFLDPDHTIAKLGSVGRPCQYLELDIWDEHGASLPADQPGEVVLRGPKVFTGYWRDPDATAKAFAGGWFHTGDIGVRDTDGFVYIVDRLKDMIVSGGENIASSEVERAIYEHPAVVEAAVVARPDDRWGEVPVAFVVTSDEATTPDELIDHCRARLAKFKVPTAVTLIEALPRNPSGKVLKRELRER